MNKELKQTLKLNKMEYDILAHRLVDIPENIEECMLEENKHTKEIIEEVTSELSSGNLTKALGISQEATYDALVDAVEGNTYCGSIDLFESYQRCVAIRNAMKSLAHKVSKFTGKDVTPPLH